MSLPKRESVPGSHAPAAETRVRREACGSKAADHARHTSRLSIAWVCGASLRELASVRYSTKTERCGASVARTCAAYACRSAWSACPGRLGCTIASLAIASVRGMQNHADAFTSFASATMYSSATPRGPACVSESGVVRPSHAGRKLLSCQSLLSMSAHPQKRRMRTPRSVSRRSSWNGRARSAASVAFTSTAPVASRTSSLTRTIRILCSGSAASVDSTRSSTPPAGLTSTRYRPRLASGEYEKPASLASPAKPSVPFPSKCTAYCPPATCAPPRPTYATTLCRCSVP
mmetsp:Transcript_36427/g.90636  ORF Transcript_36427/g.90636 Transcript_36427/m.90636 type:complete len:289 (+) Transcript_36427:1230-2096(+)